MPAAISIYDWGEEVCKLKTQKAWKASLKDKIKKMDRAEFDLFLASVVMEAAKKQIMGTILTEKIDLFKELRGSFN